MKQEGESVSELKSLKKIQEIEKEREELRLKLWKLKRKPSSLTGYLLLSIGALALASATIYSSSILAFIGLGLTFWGALFLYMRPARYVKGELLDSATISSLSNIDKIMTDLKYQGKGVYLSPRTLKELKAAVVFVPQGRDTGIPSAEELAQEKVFLKNPNGIRLVPPGLALASLLEAELGKDLSAVDLNYLQNNLPKVLIEDLEIAEDFEMETEGNIVHFRMKNVIYRELCGEVRKLQNICPSVGCPLCSSFACILTRVVDKPIVIDKTEFSRDQVDVYYHIFSH